MARRGYTKCSAGDFTDFEVVVSNNGEPVHTRELSRVITDPRVRWLEQEPATGMLSNFVAAVGEARGRYVAVLHDDDRWAPGLLAALIPPLERRQDAVLSFVDHFMVEPKGGRPGGDRAQLPAVGPDRPGTGLPPAVLRAGRSAVGGHHRVRVPAQRATLAQLPPSVGSFYDIWLCYQLACTGGAAYYHDERLLYYRWHAGSASSARGLEPARSAIAGRLRMLEDLRMRAYTGVLRERLARDHLTAGAELLRRGARRRARTTWRPRLGCTRAGRRRPGWPPAGSPRPHYSIGYRACRMTRVTNKEYGCEHCA